MRPFTSPTTEAPVSAVDAMHAAFATQLGYTLRGIVPTCRLVVRGLPSLVVDPEARPVAVRRATGEAAALEVEMDSSDMMGIGPGQELQIDQWIASGRIVVRGPSDAIARLRARVRGGIPATRYEEVAERIRDPRFVFVNHGFVELDGSDDFAWLQPVDVPWKYNLNLIRQLVRDTVIDGARVLDVGCGRGGTCSYFVRYHQPAEVVGVDLISGQVEFCRATHQAAHLRFMQADAQQLPFDDASFDVVTNVESSHCYPSLEAFFSEVRRVLKPGGVFCYTDNLPAGDTEARAARLRPYGHVRWTRRITAEVVEALHQSREPFMALVNQMAKDAGPDGPYLEQFAASILQCRNNYVAGAWDYAIWQMVR
jgi:fatty-acid O-methyltransferase